MFEEKVIAKRPSGSIPWYWEVIRDNQRSVDYIEKYLATGKVIEDKQEIVDEFTVILIRSWDSRESFDKFLLNPLTIKLFSRYQEYNEKNGITTEKSWEN